MKDNLLLKEILSRGIEKIFPSEDAAREILAQKKGLRIYLGIDPTGPSLHLGHTIQLFFLKRLLALNHKPIILIGDFTAMIGDPTGKESARKPLTRDEVVKNMEEYIGQIEKILPKNSFGIEFNSKWLASMTFAEIVKIASHTTVQQMLARDMFQERIKKNSPIALHEFLYPLMQGYDSVALDVDGEVGGSDQMFNMLVGRDFLREFKNKDKLVFTTKLITNKEGKKMSKTEGGLICLNDEPQDMYGKIMAGISDDSIGLVFELCTETDLLWIRQREKDIKTGENPKKFKEELAHEIVRIYHGQKEADKAMAGFQSVFSKGDVPEDIPVVKAASGNVNILDFLVENKISSSKSEAKRLIEQGGVKINNEVVREWSDSIQAPKGSVLQVGPRRFYRLG